MPPPPAQNVFIFMQFSEKIGQIIGWRPQSWRLPLGNPGSAAGLHCNWWGRKETRDRWMLERHHTADLDLLDICLIFELHLGLRFLVNVHLWLWNNFTLWKVALMRKNQLQRLKYQEKSTKASKIDHSLLPKHSSFAWPYVWSCVTSA